MKATKQSLDFLGVYPAGSQRRALWVRIPLGCAIIVAFLVFLHPVSTRTCGETPCNGLRQEATAFLKPQRSIPTALNFALLNRRCILDDNVKIYYDKPIKTGSSMLNNYLSLVVMNKGCVIPGCVDDRLSAKDLENLYLQGAKYYGCHSHIPSVPLQSLIAKMNVTYVTSVRSPEHRILSNYLHQYRHRKRIPIDRFLERGSDLLRYLSGASLNLSESERMSEAKNKLKLARVIFDNRCLIDRDEIARLLGVKSIMSIGLQDSNAAPKYAQDWLNHLKDSIVASRAYSQEMELYQFARGLETYKSC